MAARRLRVPQQGYQGFAALIALSDEQFAEIQGLLSSAPAPVRERELVERLASSLRLTDEQQAVLVLELVLTLYVVRTESGFRNSEELVDSLQQALSTSGAKEFGADTDWSLFRGRLTALMSLDDTVGVTAKATYLTGEQEHVVHNAELFTDIRPVFKSDAQQEPVGAILSHNLKVTYHEGNELKVIYLTFNSEGLASLRAVLERAQQKAQTLRDFLDARSLPVIGEE